MKKSRGFSMVSDAVNFLDWGTNVLTTGLILKNADKAKKTLLYSSIAMSALALGVSIVQTKKIVNAVDEVRDDVRIQILRNRI